MTAQTPDPAAWPALHAPGLYRAECPCGVSKTGTPAELRHFRRLHADVGGRHVLAIANGGQRVDQPEVTG